MTNLLDTKSSCHSPLPGVHPLHNKTYQARAYLVIQVREREKNRLRRDSLIFLFQEPLRSIRIMP